MIANAIAYSIIAIFCVLAVVSFACFIAIVGKGQSDQAASVFWNGIGFLLVGLLFAWMWGV